MDTRTKVIVWALIGFAAGLLLALPPIVWAIVGVALAAAVFALGLWSAIQLVRGMKPSKGADF
jgi:mannose/fructose/N-acetylgalactosamine-specific phosphotransferase system component IIC